MINFRSRTWKNGNGQGYHKMDPRDETDQEMVATAAEQQRLWEEGRAQQSEARDDPGPGGWARMQEDDMKRLGKTMSTRGLGAMKSEVGPGPAKPEGGFDC